jgi:diacylglycerol kinase (ATP)
MHRHIKRQMNSYRYAAKGVHHTLSTQVNIWVQLTATIVVLFLAFLLDFSLEQYVILVATIGFVLTTEIMNTALEEMTDLLSPEQQQKAGIVKDVAAGAVLVASITAAIIGIILFTYAIWAKFDLLGLSFSQIVKYF